MKTSESNQPTVVLAGHNVDVSVLRRAEELGVDPETLTPEPVSAAYARISRDPAPVTELRARAVADVARARASNERIVFGLGHASVAEHAVFNFDVLGISRLAIEALEAFRLCSYTEKSQRYIRLDGDFVVPEEVRQAGLESDFCALVAQQNEAYERLYRGILARVTEENPRLAARRSGLRTLMGVAKEDARYVTSLATTGQLGLTANARNLEHVIRRLAAHPLTEVRSLSAALLERARPVAPSLIRYPEATDDADQTPAALAALAEELCGGPDDRPAPRQQGAARLLWASEGGDRAVATALLHSGGGGDWACCEAAVDRADEATLDRLFETALTRLTAHEPVPRALELAQVCLEVQLSAACFGQLKRHRMATLLAQPYDPSLGYTIPPSIERAGLRDETMRVLDAGSTLFARLAAEQPAAAPYALSQAHRRRAIVRMNTREITHFSRLRLDRHAQWDIRDLAGEMVHLARRALPRCLMLACGKDTFADRRATLWPNE